MKRKSLILIIFTLAFCTSVFAQTTEFSYQGFFKDNNVPANGNYDLEFRLFTVASGGTVVGTQIRLNTPVVNGIFNVALDFGDFPNADRYLEIGVKPAGGGSFTYLAPRSKVLSTPYATNALNAQNALSAGNATNATFAQNAVNATNSTNATNAATAQNALQLGGVLASLFVRTNDARLSDARNPLPGSTSYIRNGTTVQTAANFIINGNGTVLGTLTGGIVNATTQFNINNNRVLTKFGVNNLFVGTLAGADNGGIQNTMVGDSAGHDNTGDENAYFGFVAGQNSTTGSDNSFFGSSSGLANSTGSENSFFGKEAGNANTTGNNNTIIGASADVGSNNLTNATAIGYQALAGQSNSLILGSVTGINGANSFTDVGIGTTTPTDRLHVVGRIRVETLGAAGTLELCRNASNQIASCSSSLRYKTGISPFSSGLHLVNRLQPISFSWKDGGMRDVGLGAEDVAAVEPLLVTYNEKGEVEGVKYDRIAVVLLNAIKEQQAQIDKQETENNTLKSEIEEQKKQLSAIRKLVCPNNLQAEVCK